MNRKMIARELLKIAGSVVSVKDDWITLDDAKKKVYKWLASLKTVKNIKEIEDGYTFEGLDYMGEDYDPFEAKIDAVKNTVTISMIRPQTRNVLKLEDLKLIASKKIKYRDYTIEEYGMNYYVKDPKGHRAFAEVPATVEIAKKWIDMEIAENGKKAKKLKAEDGQKKYYTMYNIGKVKYVVNYHDGVKTHKDGSEFYDIATFSNKKAFESFIYDLEKQGYKEKH